MYRYDGYFEPHEADDVQARAAAEQRHAPFAILRQFARRYGTGYGRAPRRAAVLKRSSVDR